MHICGAESLFRVWPLIRPKTVFISKYPMRTITGGRTADCSHRLRLLTASHTQLRLVRFTNTQQLQDFTQTPRVLITGGLGQLGPYLASYLRKSYGRDNVIVTDVVEPDDTTLTSGPFRPADTCDAVAMDALVTSQRVDWIVHLAALTSGIAEENRQKGLDVNIHSVHVMLELARRHQLKLFIPSTLGTFGPSSRLDPAHDVCIQRPHTVYGVAKVHAELMGEYYHMHHGVDFRCLRLPAVVSPYYGPWGAVSDFTVKMFYDAVRHGHHTCYLSDNTCMPMMYVEDFTRAVRELMTAHEDRLKLRTYNVSAFSLSVRDLARLIQNHLPNFTYSCQPDHRQKVADTWPRDYNDSGAREDWGWCHQYDAEMTVSSMLEQITRSSL